MMTEITRQQMVDFITSAINDDVSYVSLQDTRMLQAIRAAITEQQAQALPINEVPKGMNWTVSYSARSYVAYVGVSDEPPYYLDPACSVADTAVEALHAAITKAKNDS